MKRGARKTPEKDGRKASATRQSQRKKPSTDKKQGEEEDRQHVWLDPDATSIDCSICFMPFEAEVFMCNNGHTACAKCCVLINRKCGSCGAAIGDVRCRPAESMLAEMNTLCKFNSYGCVEVLKYVEKRRHEESCPHAPYECPFNDCTYRGLNMGLYEHIHDDHADEVSSVAYLQTTTVTLHKSTPFRLLVHESMRKVFLLLNGGGDVLAGRSLSIVCLGPRPEGTVDIRYKIEVRAPDGDVLTLLGTAPCIRQLEGFEPKKFLFVPEAEWVPSGSVSVHIRMG